MPGVVSGAANGKPGSAGTTTCTSASRGGPAVQQHAPRGTGTPGPLVDHVQLGAARRHRYPGKLADPALVHAPVVPVRPAVEQRVEGKAGDAARAVIAPRSANTRVRRSRSLSSLATGTRGSPSKA